MDASAHVARSGRVVHRSACAAGAPASAPKEAFMKLKLQPMLLALTLINLALFGYAASQQMAVAAPGDDGILRGKALQIVDDAGKVRASIAIYPAEKLRDGSVYPETVLLRLITADGRPSVKISTTDEGAGMALSDGQGLSYVQVLASGDDPKINVVDKTGAKAAVLP
jgi:hypothetical protein